MSRPAAQHVATAYHDRPLRGGLALATAHPVTTFLGLLGIKVRRELPAA